MSREPTSTAERAQVIASAESLRTLSGPPAAVIAAAEQLRKSLTNGAWRGELERAAAIIRDDTESEDEASLARSVADAVRVRVAIAQAVVAEDAPLELLEIGEQLDDELKSCGPGTHLIERDDYLRIVSETLPPRGAWWAAPIDLDEAIPEATLVAAAKVFKKPAATAVPPPDIAARKPLRERRSRLPAWMRRSLAAAGAIAAVASVVVAVRLSRPPGDGPPGSGFVEKGGPPTAATARARFLRVGRDGRPSGIRPGEPVVLASGEQLILVAASLDGREHSAAVATLGPDRTVKWLAAVAPVPPNVGAPRDAPLAHDWAPDLPADRPRSVVVVVAAEHIDDRTQRSLEGCVRSEAICPPDVAVFRWELQ